MFLPDLRKRITLVSFPLHRILIGHWCHGQFGSCHNDPLERWRGAAPRPRNGPVEVCFFAPCQKSEQGVPHPLLWSKGTARSSRSAAVPKPTTSCGCSGRIESTVSRWYYQRNSLRSKKQQTSTGPFRGRGAAPHPPPSDPVVCALNYLLSQCPLHCYTGHSCTLSEPFRLGAQRPRRADKNAHPRSPA